MYEWLLLDNTIENLGWTSKLVMRKETDARVRTWGKEMWWSNVVYLSLQLQHNWNCLVLVGRYSLPEVHRAEISSTTCKNTFKVATKLWNKVQNRPGDNFLICLLQKWLVCVLLRIHWPLALGLWKIWKRNCQWLLCIFLYWCGNKWVHWLWVGICYKRSKHV